MAPPRPPPVELSPEEQRWERFWETFQNAPFERRLEMAREVVTTEADVDEELAFELAEGVVFPAQRAGHLDAADAFLDLLVSRHPAAAAKQAAWLAMLRTENAMLRPGGDVLSALLAWIPHLADNPEFFERMFDRLLFHNRTQEATAAAAKSWPVVRDAGAFGNPESSFLSPAVHLIVDTLREPRPDLSIDDPTLRTALAPFADDLDPTRFQWEFKARSTPRPRTWSLAGLADPKQAEENLYLLSLDFRDVLHERLGWSAARAELARGVLAEALLSRKTGQPVRKKSPARRATKADSPDHGQLLIPNPASIDEYIASRLLYFLNPWPHRAAALSLALRPWLAFLSELDLATESQISSVRGELRKRVSPLPMILDRTVYDPVMQADLIDAWKGVEQEPSRVSAVLGAAQSPPAT